MRRLTYMIIAVVALTMTSCGRNKAQQQYEQFLENKNEMEFITPKEDSVKLDEKGNVSNGKSDDLDLGGSDDGLMVIPDIPQERQVNMGASDYELEKMMSGR